MADDDCRRVPRHAPDAREQRNAAVTVKQAVVATYTAKLRSLGVHIAQQSHPHRRVRRQSAASAIARRAIDLPQ
jgi:hypothetical protein